VILKRSTKQSRRTKSSTRKFILLKEDKYDEAKKYVEQAAEKEPTYAKYKHLAEVYEKLNMLTMQWNIRIKQQN
jgi:uncharacterized protein HemY